MKRDVSLDLEASAGRLGKVAAGQVSGKLDVTAKAVFEKYPDLSKLLILQTLASTYCSALNTSGMDGRERAARWEQFMSRYLELRAAPEKVIVTPPVQRPASTTPRRATAVPPATPPALSSKPTFVASPQPVAASSREQRYAAYETLLAQSQTESALSALRGLAEEGYPRAQFDLGKRYLKGELGLEQSYRSAFDLFSKAAKSGYPPAQHNLAVMYQDGLSTSQDEALAMVWYAEAARGGFAPSRELLEKLGKRW
ncbi:tetratricopeptide repeat protein [Pelomonas aquatica]|uniref:tetratricopeptide repeat protein n=1 Tax=Pelomonas aquatica TaxID=431058 RepID=UPI00286C9227|nr:tetratricopeptide repeat protein [Pelomonas aquatica]